MAIQEVIENQGHYEDKGSPQYVGLVVALKTKYDVRKMSDIWADDFYALVWTGTEAKRVYLGSNFELQGPIDRAVVDATPEVRQAYAAWEAERLERERLAQEAKAERKRLEAIEREKKAVRKGRRVRVIRGRKTPKGTEGVVFWMGRGRVGLALTDRRDQTGRNLDVAWVNEDYCEVIVEENDQADARVQKAKDDFRAARASARQSANLSRKAKRDAMWDAVANADVPF